MKRLKKIYENNFKIDITNTSYGSEFYKTGLILITTSGYDEYKNNDKYCIGCFCFCCSFIILTQLKKYKKHKKIYFMKSIVLFFSILFSLGANANDIYKPYSYNDSTCCKKTKGNGRCSGDEYCTACTSCRYCKHCNSGGTCGVCASKSQNNVVKSKSSGTNNRVNEENSDGTGQCQGITKKGTRCSRRAGSNGFCFQHGNWVLVT